MNGCSVKVVDQIASIDVEAWDDASGAAVSMDRGLLAAVEQIDDLGLQHRYFLGSDVGARAAASGSIRRSPEASGPVDALVFGRASGAVRMLGGSLGPLLVIGPELGYDTTLQSTAGHDDDERRRATLHDLCAAIEAEAARESLSVCVSRVLPDASPLAAVLEDRGYAWTWERPTAWLPVDWSDPEGYVARLALRSRKAAQNARREIARFHDSGAQLHRLDEPARHAARIDALLHAHEQRKNSHRLGYRDAFIESLAAAMRGRFTIYLASKGGTTTGAAIMLRRGSRGSMALIGMDPEQGANDFSYFNTTYYGPASDAPQLGLRCIDFGPGLLPAKQRRGCLVALPRLYYRGVRGLRRPIGRLAIVAHRHWFERKFRDLAATRAAT